VLSVVLASFGFAFGIRGGPPGEEKPGAAEYPGAGGQRRPEEAGEG
jgi:hypothetical protein